MLQRFGLLLQKKIEEAINDLKEKGFTTLGTECLLLGLIRLDTSVCKYIFSIKKINIQEIEEKILQGFYLRKKENTDKFNEVLETAEKICLADESDLIYDEHLFYALLITKDTIASYIMEEFGISIDDTLEEVKNIFDFEEEETGYLFNLTKEAQNGKLNPFIGRTKYIERVIRILSKKQKNNPMLIGNAGVGKSALVEGTAIELLKSNRNLTLYRLDLGMIIAGTRYRGDLEARLMDVIDKVKNPNTILFIDEIHNIVSSNNSENSLDIANILKPILARNEIKCIGATTLEEYYKYIAKDKALSRRFQNIFIEEPTEQEMYDILKGITPTYEKYYNVKYDKDILQMIIEKSKLITNRYFPDKAIDIIDEIGLVAKREKRIKVLKKDVKKIIFEYLGIDYASLPKKIKNIKYYPHLKKYYYNYMIAIGNRKTIMNIQIIDKYLEFLLLDIKKVLGITSSSILELDFSLYVDNHYISSLIGSPSGYVGYENGGLLTEHVYKYPLSVVIIHNYEKGSPLIHHQIESILKNGNINDSKNRCVNFYNTIFIFVTKEDNRSHLGFINNLENKKINNYIDEVIDYEITNDYNYYESKMQKYLTTLSNNDYFFKKNFIISSKKEYDEIFSFLNDLENYQNFVKYKIEKDKLGNIIIKK